MVENHNRPPQEAAFLFLSSVLIKMETIELTVSGADSMHSRVFYLY